jgi:hypothetical protein
VGGGAKMLLARRFENVGPNVSAGAKTATEFYETVATFIPTFKPNRFHQLTVHS